MVAYGTQVLAAAILTPPLDLQSTTTSPVFGAGETGDTVNRVELRANGSMWLGPGGATAPDTSFSRASAGVLATGGGMHVAGPLDVTTVGSGVKVAEGSNAKQGTATLAAGTVTVANTNITASSRIFLANISPGGTAGFLVVSAISPGASFTILSSSSIDTSVIAYQIFEPG